MATVPMQDIYNALRQLGITAKYRGYRYLALAVSLALEEEDRLLSVTKNLYPKIAEACDTTWHCVERDLRTVIQNCWNSTDHTVLEMMAGRRLTERPSTVSFIEILVGYFSRGDEAAS